MYLLVTSEQAQRDRLHVWSVQENPWIIRRRSDSKGLTYGGSLARTEATGYGLLYLTNALLKIMVLISQARHVQYPVPVM